MDGDHADMELDFNPFDSTFDSFGDIDGQGVESLAQELQFYEEKAEYLAGQGALENFSLSRDSYHHGYFADDVNHLETSLQQHEAASASGSDVHYDPTSYRGYPPTPERGTKTQGGASSSKSAEEQGPQRSSSSGADKSLKRTLSEQVHPVSAHYEEAQSKRVSGYGSLSLGHNPKAAEPVGRNREPDTFEQHFDAIGGHGSPFRRLPDSFGQHSNSATARHHLDRPHSSNELHQLGSLEDSLLGSLMEHRDEPHPFSNDNEPLFQFGQDSKPFDLGASVFGNLSNGTAELHGVGKKSEKKDRGGGQNGVLEPGLLTPEDAHEITKANMWVSSDGDDRPIGSLKSPAKPKRTSSREGKKGSRKRSAATVAKKLDPIEVARLEKNRIKAQRHRDKMKAWKEDVKLENEDLRAQRQKLAEEREALAAGKASLEQEKHDMEKTLARLQEDVARLQSENARLWKESHERTGLAQAGQRQADAELLNEPREKEDPRVSELQKLNERLKDQNALLEEELAVVKGAFAAQLHTMSNLVAIRPPSRDDEHELKIFGS